MIAGCDPGRAGAVAWLGEEPGFVCLDTGSPSSVAEAMLGLAAGGCTLLTVERNHSMPKMGPSSAFTFGVSWGVVRGAAAACGLPVRLVTAQKWRAWALRGRGVPAERADREAATAAAAMERWPALAWPKAKKDRQGVACALFLAAYPEAST